MNTMKWASYGLLPEINWWHDEVTPANVSFQTTATLCVAFGPRQTQSHRWLLLSYLISSSIRSCSVWQLRILFLIFVKKKIKLIIKTTVLFLWIRSTGRRCRSPFRKIFFTGLFFIQMAWHFHHFVVFFMGFFKKFYAGFFGGKFSSRPVKCAVSNAINSFIFQSNLMRF